LWLGVALAAMLGQIGLPGGGFGHGYGSVVAVGEPAPQVGVPRLRQGRNAVSTYIPVARWSSRAVRSQQAQYHARPDRQIDAVHCQRLPEPLDQAYRLDRESHGMRSSGPGHIER
jgi:anaerobic selenocysteine-containing dehydrogenase